MKPYSDAWCRAVADGLTRRTGRHWSAYDSRYGWRVVYQPRRHGPKIEIVPCYTDRRMVTVCVYGGNRMGFAFVPDTLVTIGPLDEPDKVAAALACHWMRPGLRFLDELQRLEDRLDELEGAT